MKFRGLAMGITCVAILGCISSSSVHPILTDDDLSHDVDLNGTWRQLDIREGYHRVPEFTGEGWDENARYDLTLKLQRPEMVREGQKVIPTEYDVAVGRIGGSRFLQVRRSELVTGGPSFFEGVVTYAFAKFDIKDHVLLVYPINDHALETLLPKTMMAHFMHKPDDWARNIVITESTPRLQELLKKHHESLFYKEPLKFRRVLAGTEKQTHAPGPAAASVLAGESAPSATPHKNSRTASSFSQNTPRSATFSCKERPPFPGGRPHNPNL